MKRNAIIGFGCAGYNAAHALRRASPDAHIDIFETTAQPPFNPMLSTYYASEKLPYEAVFPFGGLDEIARDLSLNIKSGCEAVRVDPGRKAVELAGGERLAYDNILIATGARAMVVGALQCKTENSFLMRTLDDARRLRRYLDTHSVKTAAVIGGSMVGVKVAELLHGRGVEVTILDAAPYLFPLAAYKNVSMDIQRRLEDKQVRFMFSAKVSAIDGRGVALGGGGRIDADIVCLCIGTTANIELAANTKVVEDSGIETGKGIIVDSRMGTSSPGIYAAGDCCEGVNLQTGKTAIIGLWANAGAQGRCAGLNMGGRRTDYYGNILHNITHFFDMDFIGLGDASLEGERFRFEHGGFSIDVVMDVDRLTSVNIFGNYKISGILKNHLTKQLLGAPCALTTAQACILERYGLDREFIRLIGGAK